MRGMKGIVMRKKLFWAWMVFEVLDWVVLPAVVIYWGLL